MANKKKQINIPFKEFINETFVSVKGIISFISH